MLLEVLKVLKGLLEVGGAAEGSGGAAEGSGGAAEGSGGAAEGSGGAADGSGGAAGGLLTICARLCSYLPCITLHKRKTETRHL